MLPQFDPDLVGWLMEKFREVGIDVHTRSQVEAIEKTGKGYPATMPRSLRRICLEATA
jgi:glutathione reductase (NADPH)